jgi:hypothetical protein
LFLYNLFPRSKIIRITDKQTTYWLTLTTVDSPWLSTFNRASFRLKMQWLKTKSLMSPGQPHQVGRTIKNLYFFTFYWNYCLTLSTHFSDSVVQSLKPEDQELNELKPVFHRQICNIWIDYSSSFARKTT